MTHHLYDPLRLPHVLYVKVSGWSVVHLLLQLLVGRGHLGQEALQPLKH